jgi:two-component system phosphate regulon sensor histidine kinase PhoR
MVNGNPELFNMVVGNLIDNAIKYNQSQPIINVNLACSNKEVIITIADNGIGIPPKYVGNIFDKYFRVPTGDVHDNKGFGLGLFMVSQAVKAMNGSISVESALGKGTTFTIKLQGKCK